MAIMSLIQKNLAMVFIDMSFIFKIRHFKKINKFTGDRYIIMVYNYK